MAANGVSTELGVDGDPRSAAAVLSALPMCLLPGYQPVEFSCS